MTNIVSLVIRGSDRNELYSEHARQMYFIRSTLRLNPAARTCDYGVCYLHNLTVFLSVFDIVREKDCAFVSNRM